MDSKISEYRKGSFKNRNAMQQDELRRRREDVAVEIRKQKREESMAKRRNLQVMSTVADSDSSDNEGEFDERAENEVSFEN